MSDLNVDNLFESLDWIKARHEVWQKRQSAAPAPWTDHPIVGSRKFTNVFRILDPGTQFVLTDLNCDDPEEFLLRLLLYRNTNLPVVWQHFDGEVDLRRNLQVFKQHLHAYKARYGGVFSGAYMVWGGTVKGVDKIDHVTGWLEELLNLGVPTDFLMATTQQERFDILKGCRGVGGFIAMQVLTDFGYGDFDRVDRENEFVVPGPGAHKGADWIWHGRDAVEVIRMIRDMLWDDPECPTLHLPGGLLRKPSLMDVQNCMCETSKLARYLKKPVGAPYAPAHPGVQPRPQYPRHWY